MCLNSTRTKKLVPCLIQQWEDSVHAKEFLEIWAAVGLPRFLQGKSFTTAISLSWIKPRWSIKRMLSLALTAGTLWVSAPASAIRSACLLPKTHHSFIQNVFSKLLGYNVCVKGINQMLKARFFSCMRLKSSTHRSPLLANLARATLCCKCAWWFHTMWGRLWHNQIHCWLRANLQ